VNGCTTQGDVHLQGPSLAESRYLYDQLAPLTPVLLALTAATPFLRGWICDDDTRWGQVAQSVDDRTAAERGLEGSEEAPGDDRLAGRGVRRLQKSRYDGIDCYIGEGPEAAEHNDVPLVLDEDFVERLRAGGVDETLARHVAHLFNRDPLVIFSDRVHLDDEHDVDHWENLQSTNWQTLRWKPPPPEKAALDSTHASHIGWRVEFRSMEVQMTDFENAAFTAFVILVSRMILAKRPNLYVPISKLEESMQAAKRREAVTRERFWFRPSASASDTSAPPALLSVQEILMGMGAYAGLIPLCRRYLDEEGCDWATRAPLERYLDFIALRAEGALPTPATWMRDFVLRHEAYQQDGRVPPAAAHDLMVAATEIGAGCRPCPELLGDVVVPPLAPQAAEAAGAGCPPVCRPRIAEPHCSPLCMARERTLSDSSVVVV